MMNELSDTLELCYSHPEVFNLTMMAETFSTPFTPHHFELIRAFHGPSQKVVAAATRGLGKTVLLRSVALYSILFRTFEFIVYVSQSESLAMMQTENIKRELQTNPTIRKIFGSVKIDDVSDADAEEAFSKHAWTAFGNTLIMPRGAGQQVRGLIYKSTRPQLIIVDDFENRREVQNPENRRKNKEWFNSDLLRCVDRYSDKWKILYVDTLKHSESLLQELLNDPDWDSHRLELFDENYHSHVPLLFSDEEIKREIDSARRSGTLDLLYMELQSVPVSRETQSFRTEYFKYYQVADLVGKSVESLVIVDPAKTAQIQSADSAIVGVSVDYSSGIIYVRDVVSGKMYPDEIYEQMFSMALRLKSHVIGVEVTGLEEFIKQPILNEMQKRGPMYTFEMVWLKARGGDPGGEKGKLKRIGTLLPYYRQGHVYHSESCCAKLEAQLLSFPSSGLVDVADAFAYTIEMLELGGRYFTTPDELIGNDEEDEAAFAALYEDTEERLVYGRRI